MTETKTDTKKAKETVEGDSNEVSLKKCIFARVCGLATGDPNPIQSNPNPNPNPNPCPCLSLTQVASKRNFIKGFKTCTTHVKTATPTGDCFKQTNFA